MVTEVEMDWLFSEVEPGQLELGNNNNVANYDDTLPQSQVPLFTTIRSSTNKPNDGPHVALEEEGNRESVCRNRRVLPGP